MLEIEPKRFNLEKKNQKYIGNCKVGKVLEKSSPGKVSEAKLEKVGSKTK